MYTPNELLGAIDSIKEQVERLKCKDSIQFVSGIIPMSLEDRIKLYGKKKKKKKRKYQKKKKNHEEKVEMRGVKGMTPTESIEKIEKALGIKLFEKQVQYIVGSRNIEWGRKEGRTVAHCIKKALIMSKDDIDVVLDMSRPQEFSDRYYDIAYSRHTYRDLFFRIWKKLKAGGLPVVKLSNNGKRIG